MWTKLSLLKTQGGASLVNLFYFDIVDINIEFNYIYFVDKEASAEPHKETHERLHGMVAAAEETDHSCQPWRSQCRNF